MIKSILNTLKDRVTFLMAVKLPCLFLLLIIFTCIAFAGTIHSPIMTKGDDSVVTHERNSLYRYRSFDEFQGNVNNDTQDYILTNSMLGFSGPLSFSLTFSDQYHFIFNTQYVSLINAMNAFSIEADLGARENRINITAAHAFSLQNRLKLTVERLGQKQSFTFDSGVVDTWVSQYAGGAVFQHLLGEGVLNNISIGGYYARAPNKTLSPTIYSFQNTFFVNYRHIAGSTSVGMNTSIGIQPWATGIVTLTGYYDCVRYHHIYNNVSAPDKTNIGYGIALSQYISSSLQGSLNYAYRAIYRTLAVSIQWMHNVFHDKRSIALSIAASQTRSDTIAYDNRLTLGLNYYFVPMSNAYQPPTFNMLSLKNWTAEPAVRMDEVLAAADQLSEKVNLSSSININEFVTHGIISADIDWTKASTNIPNAHIIYKLSVEKTSNVESVNHSVEYFEPFKDKLITNDRHFTITKLEPGVWYRAKLSLIETTTGIEKLEEKAFQALIDTLYWPHHDAHFAYHCTAEGANAMCEVDWDTVTVSLEGDSVTYTINGIESKNVTDQQCDINSGHCTATLESLTLGKPLSLSITAKDQYDVTTTSKTYLVSVPTAAITGFDEIKCKALENPTQGDVSWSMAQSSDPNDQILYVLDYDSQSKSIYNRECDVKTNACDYLLSDLTPEHLYQIKVTASGTVSNASASQPLFCSFKTAAVQFQSWTPDLKYAYKTKDLTSGTLTWTPITTNITNESSSDESYQISFDEKGPQMLGEASCNASVCTQKVQGLTVGTTVTGKISVTNTKYNILTQQEFKPFPVDNVFLQPVEDLNFSYNDGQPTLSWTQPSIVLASDHNVIVSNDAVDRYVFYHLPPNSISSAGNSISASQMNCTNGNCTVPVNNLDHDVSYSDVYLTYGDTRYHQTSSESNRITIRAIEWENWSSDVIDLSYIDIPIDMRPGVQFTVKFTPNATTVPSLGNITYTYQITGDIAKNSPNTSGSLSQGQLYSHTFIASTIVNPTITVTITAHTSNGEINQPITKSLTAHLSN
jgi:hypothetical protein